jgi:hypothetical protein
LGDRTCTVSFTDVRGIRHSVELTADSLFEAAALGLNVLRTGDWNDPPTQSTLLEVEVRNPSVKHTVSVQQLARWLNGASNSPRESMKKIALRKILTST